MSKMRIRCRHCTIQFVVDAHHGGRWGKCSVCGGRTLLPIPDPQALLKWATDTSYERLARFIRHGGAHGHEKTTIGELVRIAEQRRWLAESRVRGELQRARAERKRKRLEEQAARQQTLEDLRNMTPAEFEQFVATLFNQQGFRAIRVGGCSDGGVDVLIQQEGSIWGVAQCKRYGRKSRVSAEQIREFGGAFMLSNAPNGFFFTTNTLTRQARRAADGFPWLKVYAGQELMSSVERVRFSALPQFGGRDDLPGQSA